MHSVVSNPSVCALRYTAPHACTTRYHWSFSGMVHSAVSNTSICAQRYTAPHSCTTRYHWSFSGMVHVFFCCLKSWKFTQSKRQSKILISFAFKVFNLCLVFMPSVYKNSHVIETFYFFNQIRTNEQLRTGFYPLIGHNHEFRFWSI